MSDGKVIIDTELNTKDAEKQSKTLGNTISSGLGKGAKVAKAGVMAVGTAVAVTSGAMIKGAKDTAEYGDHIDKMSQKLGISAEAYQKWDYVAKISGTSIDGLKMGFKTLTNTIDKANQGDKTAIENFNRIGMSIDDLKGKSKEDIFENTVKSLQNMEDATERSAMANKLLGRAGMELGPLLNSNNKDIDELMKTAEDYGMIMSDDAVKASAKFQDSLTTMGQTFTGMKNRMMAEFLPALTQVTDGLALVFKGDTDAGIEKINEGITGFIDKLGEIMPKVLEVGGNIIMTLATAILTNLPQLFETGTQIVLQLLQGFISALPNLITGIVGVIPVIVQTLINALPQLLTGLMTGLQTLATSLTQMLPTLITTLITGVMNFLITSIPTLIPQLIQLAIQLLLGLVQGLMEAIPVFINMLPQLIQAILDAVIQSLPLIINGLIQLVTMIVQQLPTIIMAIVNALPQIITMVINALITALPQLINGVIQLVLLLVENLPKIIIALIKAIPKIIVSVVNALIKALPQLIKGVIQLVIMLVKNLPKIIMGLIKAIPTIIVEVVKALIEALPTLIKGVLDLIVGLVKALPKLLSKLWDFLKTLPSKIVSFFKEMPSKMLQVGKDLIKGLWNGIKNVTKWIMDKIGGFVDDVVGGIKDFFGIGSPSKLMRDEVGQWVAKGIWVGFDKHNPMDQINDAIANGYQQIETTAQINSVIDYSRMVDAIADAGLVVQFEKREVGRMVREFA